ncbi:hypothetical protein HUJ04_011178 [Dendroctonus ponderosae]|nr:hypothetical protein HUJ04_011178 [Dendroctonus ponderosae]
MPLAAPPTTQSRKVRSKCSTQRLPKRQESCKLNRNCTSFIRMIQAKNILVTWLKTHYGHKSELQHLRLPQQDKAMVASKLILGVPASRILDSYREKINEKDLNREDLITRKDIQNIKEAYHINISEGVKHDNDAISVDLWVKQCNQEECSCILFYKQQGVEEHDYQLSIVDFCLVIMTDFQKNIMNFGNNIVAIDGTHGIPVAFMFSNRKDIYIYELFFRVIRLNLGLISSKIFMTDIVSTFYNAWCSAMSPVNQQLFCSWHIDRAWQQNLSKISNKEKRSEVYKVIKCLQQNTSEDVFSEFLQNSILQMLSDSEIQDFGLYFQNN